MNKWGGNGATEYTGQNMLAMIFVVLVLLAVYYFYWRKKG